MAVKTETVQPQPGDKVVVNGRAKTGEDNPIILVKFREDGMADVSVGGNSGWVQEVPAGVVKKADES